MFFLKSLVIKIHLTKSFWSISLLRVLRAMISTHFTFKLFKFPLQLLWNTVNASFGDINFFQFNVFCVCLYLVLEVSHHTILTVRDDHVESYHNDQLLLQYLQYKSYFCISNTILSFHFKSCPQMIIPDCTDFGVDSFPVHFSHPCPPAFLKMYLLSKCKIISQGVLSFL